MTKAFVETLKVCTITLVFMALVCFGIIHYLIAVMKPEAVNENTAKQLMYATMYVPFPMVLLAAMLSLIALLWHIIDLPTKK